MENRWKDEVLGMFEAFEDQRMTVGSSLQEACSLTESAESYADDAESSSEEAETFSEAAKGEASEASSKAQAARHEVEAASEELRELKNIVEELEGLFKAHECKGTSEVEDDDVAVLDRHNEAVIACEVLTKAIATSALQHTNTGTEAVRALTRNPASARWLRTACTVALAGDATSSSAEDEVVIDTDLDTQSAA